MLQAQEETQPPPLPDHVDVRTENPPYPPTDLRTGKATGYKVDTEEESKKCF